MKFWDDLKNYFYQQKLNGAIRNVKAIHTVTNLTDAKTIGIVYDSTKPDNDIIITKFAEHLRAEGKTVEILGYINDPKVESKADILVFNKKALSWTGIPNSDRVKAFTDKKFDLLFAAFTGRHPALEYVAATSKAKWRLGVYTKGKTDLYDMMVMMDGKNDLQYFLNQSVYFLNEIKYDPN